MNVFPTRVGMVRSFMDAVSILIGFPHACGDGPAGGETGRKQCEFSPRVWGWSEIKPQRPALRPVFPTRVGMVRASLVVMASPERFPHACGDGPHLAGATGGDMRFSPRVWGWSAKKITVRQQWAVFPTRVGMVQFAQCLVRTYDRFPHACGDGPESAMDSLQAMWFSPRVWGWSDGVGAVHCLFGVFPTRVGMVRDVWAGRRARHGFPHACGDGPTQPGDDETVDLFSPRVWGWSDFRNAERPWVFVFPTRVGMVRLENTTRISN